MSIKVSRQQEPHVHLGLLLPLVFCVSVVNKNEVRKKQLLDVYFCRPIDSFASFTEKRSVIKQLI